MESQPAQNPLDALIPPPELSEPATPELSHSTISNATAAVVSKVQTSRVEDATADMTPPPSAQIPPSSRVKTRTPTPTASHISTPPPTIELPNQALGNRVLGGYAGSMTAAEISSASVEELRSKITELQAAVQEAKMSAAHHKLQYQMLSQESAAAIERMAVEARMTQYENEIIHIAEQAKSRPGAQAQQSLLQEGMIPVQKELYHNMCREIQLLKEANSALERECDQQQNVILGQENEIASLGDKVTLMRERIRENREHLQKYRRGLGVQSTPRSAYSTPQRGGHMANQGQPHRFAALLQASEMASSQESSRSTKKGHTRNTHSMSSLPTTPQHMHKQTHTTPHGRQPALTVPATAPVSRTHAPDIYQQHQRLPVPPAPASEGTVSASDNDSEAETDIIDPDDDIDESHASRAASQMLRSSQEQQAKRESFQGAGMLPSATGGERLKQSKLFGAVRKAGVDRGGDEPPAKRARTGERAAVGLGIAGVRG